jgi:hypothetical protein
MPRKANSRPNTDLQEDSKLRDAYVRLDKIASVTSPCQTAIRNVTGLTWISFKPLSADKSRKKLLELSGPGITRATADGQEHSVVPLLPIKSRDSTRGPAYWVAVKLEYDLEQKTKELCLISVQLFIFQSILASSSEKRALLRIEWDCRTGYLLDTHAQPHWHVYPSLLTTSEEFSGSNAFDDAGIVVDFNPSPERDVTMFSEGATKDKSTLPPGARFHFALAADWQKPITTPQRQNHELKLDQLGNWMEWCLTYIREQFIYIDDKTRPKE